MSTYKNVKAQIAKLEKQASDLYKNEVAVAIEKARGMVAQYGLTAADLGLPGKSAKAVKGPRKGKAAAKPAGIPMYADPVSGKTWTGKGKHPAWIVEGLKKGKSKTDFLIGKPAVAPAAVAKAAKPAKAVKAVKAEKKPAPAPKAAKKVAAKPAVKKVAAKKPATKAVEATA